MKALVSMVMHGRRGQAFETMMLVISVIVAIAILTILLGFLGGISFGATDAKSVISDLLKAVDRKGVGLDQKAPATFDKTIFAAEVTAGTAILKEDVKFYCEDDATFCGGSGGAPINIGSGGASSIKVTRKANGAIVVCKGEGKTEYSVCVGRPERLNDVADACSSKCELA